MPMTLSATPHAVWFQIPTRPLISFVIWNFSRLQRMRKIEPDDLCPIITPKLIEETFLKTMNQVWIWNTTERKELMKTVTAHCSLLWVEKTGT